MSAPGIGVWSKLCTGKRFTDCVGVGLIEFELSAACCEAKLALSPAASGDCDVPMKLSQMPYRGVKLTTASAEIGHSRVMLATNGLLKDNPKFSMTG